MNYLDALLDGLLSAGPYRVKRRGRPRSLGRRALAIDAEIYALKHDKGISLGKARREVAKTNKLHIDYVRFLQRTALQLHLDNIVESQMENLIFERGTEMFEAVE